MPQLTQEQIQMYLAAGGLRCPYCGSTQIQGNEWNADSGSATQEVGCNDCDESWLDVYSLVGVESIE